MADKYDGATLLANLVHPAETLFLERRVADRQDLIDQQDLGLEVRRYRKGEPDIHSGAVPLDRRIQESIDLGKADNLIELCSYLISRHPENRAVQKDVLSTRQLGVKSGADF